MVNIETLYERLEELYSCVESFPESKLLPIWEHAIAELEGQAAIYL